MILSLCLTLASFVVGHQLEQGLHSALSSIVISTFSLLHRTQDAMVAFLLYLFLDIIWRHKSDPLPKEIALHHFVSICITISGLYLSFTLKDTFQLFKICSLLLNMEITNSILFLSKKFKNDGNSKLAGLSLCILILAWIPFRLINPIKAFYISFYKLPDLKSIQIIIIILFVLQCLWFSRLLEILRKSLVSKNERTKNITQSISKKETLRKNSI